MLFALIIVIIIIIIYLYYTETFAVHVATGKVTIDDGDFKETHEFNSQRLLRHFIRGSIKSVEWDIKDGGIEIWAWEPLHSEWGSTMSTWISPQELGDEIRFTPNWRLVLKARGKGSADVDKFNKKKIIRYYLKTSK